MTTFHDGPPPQSRRAARESERAASTTGQDVDLTAAQPTADAVNADEARERSEAERPAPGGRRAQRPAGGPDANAAAPVSQIPSYDGPSFARTARQASDPADTSADASADDAPYKLRDYSPEGRRAAQSSSTQAAELDYRTQAATPAWQAPAAAPVEAPADSAPSSETPAAAPAQPMTRRERRAMEERAAAEAAAAELVEPPAASVSVDALSSAIAEFEALTLSQAGQQTGAIPLPRPVITPAATDAPSPSQNVEFLEAAEEPAGEVGQQETERADSDWHTVEAPASTPLLSAPLFAEPSEPLDAAEPAPFPFALQSSSNVFNTPVVAPPAAEDGVSDVVSEQAPVDETPLRQIPAFEVPVEAAPVAPVLVEPTPNDELPSWARDTQAWTRSEHTDDDDVDEDPIGETESRFGAPPVVRESYTPPVGHWSRQAELDDELPMESTLSREVGASNLSTTTSALILPSIPQSDFSGLINGTGEILITGTIELPSSLGTMGGDSRHFDHPDVDHMFDAFDKELVSNDSQPVRAIRAVSTHTQTRGVIQINTKPAGSRLTTVAIVAACVIAAAAVGLLIFFVVNNL